MLLGEDFDLPAEFGDLRRELVRSIPRCLISLSLEGRRVKRRKENSAPRFPQFFLGREAPKRSKHTTREERVEYNLALEVSVENFLEIVEFGEERLVAERD